MGPIEGPAAAREAQNPLRRTTDPMRRAQPMFWRLMPIKCRNQVVGTMELVWADMGVAKASMMLEAQASCSLWARVRRACRIQYVRARAGKAWAGHTKQTTGPEHCGEGGGGG